MKEITISILLILGTFFIFSSSVGVLRFPDVYSRLHAASKSATLGVAGVLIAAFLFFLFEEHVVSGKLLLGIVFVLLTSPVAGHMISRAAYRSGVTLSDKTVTDELKAYIKNDQKRNAK
ncbi:monovalent cation/H(+) antiporter subunit G [Bacillus taeanensis]|uniref:Na+/H+ antiporter subunit G n=1 Tax=Bacillus taeanensis TaxID=273032 RepID=A0A366XY26_9BACI|nr:monovalent cation/H(+) antiporter subunit G [Bacillus taeanensis]RBW70468.1 Na+/H+ antiporter subunit G [Bacillus taeanensis]